MNNRPDAKRKYIIPDNFLYEESRSLFKQPDVETDKEVLESYLKWGKPVDEDVKDFLIN